MKKLLLLLPLLLLYHCASSSYSSGTYFDKAMVDKIKQDTTTVAQVEALFGKPTTINMSDDNLTYSYVYTESKASSQSYVFAVDYKVQGYQRFLTVIFDKNNVVKKFNYSESPINIKSN